MAVKKISVALDPDVADAAATVAEAAGQSLSSWLNDAARQQLRVQQGLAAVREWEQEYGTLTDEERAAAQATLDALSSRPARRSA
jgi:alkylhydroperoxidase family enzyme